MQAAVFLARDNTLIHSEGGVFDPADVRLIQGAATAIASLCGLGYKIVLVTNQSGVAHGKCTEDDVRAVHEQIQALIKRASSGVRIDAFYFCPYHPEASIEQYRQDHPTRKPRPGMLEQAAKDLKLDLSQSWMIGARTRDVQAGRAAGCRTVLLRPDAQRIAPDDEVPAVTEKTAPEHPEQKGDAAPDSTPDTTPDVVARNLVEAVRVVAQQRKPEAAEESHKAPAGELGGKRWDAAAVAKLQRPASDAAGTRFDPDRGQDVDEPAPPASSREPGHRDETTPPRPKRARRPFRPVGAPVPKEEADDEPLVARRRREAKPEAKPEARPEGESAEPGPPAESAAPVKPAAPAKPITPEEPDESATDRSPAAETPLEPEPPKTAEAAPVSDDEPVPRAGATASESPTTRTLRLILQELRQQRGTHHEQFSYPKLIAIVLQMIAAICLLGGLWMGSGDTDLFWRWMGAGLIMQGATIAMLLFDR